MWADNEADLDLLGYDYLVDGLVVALTEPRLLPLTVGVLGDWGSGKSSLMGLAAKELRTIKLADIGVQPPAEDQSRAAYLTIEFSPWQHEDYDDVKVALMAAVLDALQERMPDQAAEINRLKAFLSTLKRWGRRLGRVGSGATPTAAPLVLELVAPGLGTTTSALLAAAATAAAAETQRALAEPANDGTEATIDPQPTPLDIKGFRDSFARLVEELPEQAVIVFIDDLDRCLPDTVVDTFEAIRLFLNTPQTAYVLALNQSVVESSIDSRYPELRRPDGAGIGRDYLEKMLQLKVTIPALSAPEAETYANLLFAELHLDADQFAKVLNAAADNRKNNGLSVAFNSGIATACLDKVPAALAKDLAWAAEITPVMGASLRGNPRQLKRFLNNLLLKFRSAQRRQVALELPILAKLMVLEDQYKTDFQKLFDWEMAAEGQCTELTTAEDRARAGGAARTPSTQDNTEETKPKKKAASSAAEVITPSEAEAWADKPHVGDWLRTEPRLTGIDLRPYFTYSRDKLSFGVSASRLPPHLQKLLTALQSDVAAFRRSQLAEVTALDPSERAKLMEALLERAQRYPGGVAPTAALEVAEQNPDVVESVCVSLGQIPPATIPPALGGTAVLRLPKDSSAARALLDAWEASDHAALKTLVNTARAAESAKIK